MQELFSEGRKDPDTERKDSNILIFVLLPNRLGRKITVTSSPDSIKSLMNNVLSMKNALDSTTYRNLKSLSRFFSLNRAPD